VCDILEDLALRRIMDDLLAGIEIPPPDMCLLLTELDQRDVWPLGLRAQLEFNINFFEGMEWTFLMTTKFEKRQAQYL